MRSLFCVVTLMCRYEIIMFRSVNLSSRSVTQALLIFLFNALCYIVAQHVSTAILIRSSMLDALLQC